jgi:gas vesicle protein
MERTDLFKLLVGFSVGAATGLLLAPDSRKKVRSGITDAATGGAHYLRECTETVRDAVLDILEERKDDIARHKEGLAEAIKRGTEAYRRVVNEPAPSTM